MKNFTFENPRTGQQGGPQQPGKGGNMPPRPDEKKDDEEKDGESSR